MSEESSSSSPRLPNKPLHETTTTHPPAAPLTLVGKPNNQTNDNERTTTTTSIASTGNQVTTTTTRPRFNPTWHGASDMRDRRIILSAIVRSIHRRRPNAPSSMKKQLPMMAKKMEEALYKEAPSKKVYMDLSTLEHRLEELARKVQEQVEALKKMKNATTSTNP